LFSDKKVRKGALRPVYALPPSLITNLKIKKMPKVKTNSGAKKRFSFTGTGKVKRHHAYHSHILTKKTKKQKRNLVGYTIVDNSNMKQVRDLLNLR
jgi:large subunit ribosomal protein L35